MANTKRIKSKRKAKRLERNKMLRNPSEWEEPPEDEDDTDFDPPEPNVDPGPVEDRDCDYWEREVE